MIKCYNPECGNVFTNFVGDQIIANKKYCSSKCRKKYERLHYIKPIKEKLIINDICIECDKSLIRTFPSKKQKFCSDKCCQKNWVNLNKNRYNDSRKRWAASHKEYDLKRKRDYNKTGKPREQKRLRVISLSDTYMIERLGFYGDLKPNNINELIEQKRLQLKIIRKIKQFKTHEKQRNVNPH